MFAQLDGEGQCRGVAGMGARGDLMLLTRLYVPGDRPDRFAKAVASGTDAIILDLEDAVAASGKEYARAAVAEFLTDLPAVPAFVRTAVSLADRAGVRVGSPTAF
jgi:hypothetical protein